MIKLNFDSIVKVLGPTREKEVITVVQNTERQILIITKNGYPDGVYRFPGGGIEKNESPEEALTREGKEEFNRELETVRQLGIIEVEITDRQGARDWESHIFLVKINKPLDLSEDSEHSDHQWIEVKDLHVYIKRMKEIPTYNREGMNQRDWASLRVLPLEFVYDKLS